MTQPRTGRLLWLLAALLALVMLAAACGEEDAEEPTEPGDAAESPADEDALPEFETLEDGVLTVASDIPYPPFEFRRGGELVGFDVDLIEEVASRLNLETNVIDTSFDTIFSQLAGGRFDVVIAASTITPERAEEVNFSDGYYNAQQSLTVQSEAGIGGVADLESGMTVAVQNGTTGKAWAEENLPDGVDIRAFPEGPDGYTALEAGDVDGVINDEPTAIAEIAERPGLEVIETIDTGEVYGIAVDPANEELLEAINFVLAEMVEDGTYEEIYSRYEDLPPGGSIAASE